MKPTREEVQDVLKRVGDTMIKLIEIRDEIETKQVEERALQKWLSLERDELRSLTFN